jgi:Ca2+/Na+ antiporter
MKKFRAWLWVALCAAAIFLVVPTARAIQKFVGEHWGRAFFGYLVVVVMAAAFLGILYLLIVRLKIHAASNYIWLAVCAALYLYFTLKLWRNPEEAVHFLEYGLLGFLLFRAWRLTVPDKAVYLASFLTGTLVGTFDEIFQWFMPGRYWDIRDVGLNALAVGLFQVALWQGVRPKLASSRIAPKSVRKISVLFATNLLLLGLCMSNTPDRTSALAGRFPALAFLEKEEPMREFKMKHKDPEIGSFYSRMTVERLKVADFEKSVEYGRIMREWRDKDYNGFLETFNPLNNPFLYEMRVHIFRRDRKYEEGQKAGSERRKKEAFFIAFKENLILEKYFACTLRSSGYPWEREKAAAIEPLIEKNAAYTSPVSKDLFYWLSEGAMWIGICVAFIALIGLNILLKKRGHTLSVSP